MRCFLLIVLIACFFQPISAQRLYKWEKKEILDNLWPKNIRKSEKLYPQLFGIYQRNKLIFQKSFGNSNFPTNESIDQHTIFYTGQLGQVFTAICILNLWHDKKLNLEDSVRKYFPSLPKVYENTNIQHLLSHTSGIMTIYQLYANKMEVEETVDENIDVLFTLQDTTICTKSLPGIEFSLNMVNYWLLARIIEIVTGSSLKTFAYNNIFQPLEMFNTCFSEQKDIIPIAINSETKAYYLVERLQFEGVGMGGLYSSMSDIQKFMAAFFEDHFFERKVKEKLIDKPILDRAINANKRLAGIHQYTINGKKSYHFPQNSSTYGLVYTPEIKTSFIILNYYHYSFLNKVAMVLTTLYGDDWINDLTKRVKEIERIGQVNQYNGRYIELNSKRISTINFAFRDLRTRKEKRRQRHESYLWPLTNYPNEVVALSDNRLFAPKGNTIWEFFPVGDGFKMKEYRYGVFNGIYYKHVFLKLTYEQILNFTGTYQSPSGLASDRIKITRSGEESLSVSIGPTPAVPLRRLGHLRFITNEEVIINFKRNSQNEVVGIHKISKDLESLYYQKIDD